MNNPIKITVEQGDSKLEITQGLLLPDTMGSIDEWEDVFRKILCHRGFTEESINVLFH